MSAKTKALLCTLFISLITLTFIEAQVTVIEPNVTVTCFDLNDFSESDLQIDCDAGFEFLDITTIEDSLTSEACTTGSTFVIYSGLTYCGDTFYVTKGVTITNPGLQVEGIQDVTVSCVTDINPQPTDITVTSTCGGEPSIVIEEILIDTISLSCFNARKSFRYTINDNCERLVYTQRFTVINDPLRIEIGDTFAVVTCVEEINISQFDATISLPCEAEIIDYIFQAPDLSSPLASCNGARHTFSWILITSCGSVAASKSVEIVNEGIALQEPEDVTISCSEHPLDDASLMEGVSVSNPCGIGDGPIPIILSRPNEDLPEEFCENVTFNYEFEILNECTGSYEYVVKYVTVVPELPSIDINEQIAFISCDTDLESIDLLEGVVFNFPCSSEEYRNIDGPYLISGISGCPGTSYEVYYEVEDECANLAEATKTIVIEDRLLEITVAADEVVNCIENILVSEEDVTITEGCGSVDVQVLPPSNYYSISSPACPGTIFTFEYLISSECYEDTSVFRSFTIDDGDLLIAFRDGEIDNGAILNFGCSAEDTLLLNLSRLNENSVFVSSICVQDSAYIQGIDIDFTIAEISSDDCSEEGFLKRFQVSWVATDRCGRTAVFSFTADLVDEMAPVILGVPEDVTISCEQEVSALAIVQAIDNCQAVDVLVQEETTPATSSGEVVIIRRWIATDDCGNSSQETQRITIVDDVAPLLRFIDYKGNEISNGAIFSIECDEDLSWIQELSEKDITAADNCGCAHTEFQLINNDDKDPSVPKLKEVFIPTWSVADEAGNISTFSFTAQIVDTKPPGFIGTDTLFICSDESAGFFIPLDACGGASSSRQDIRMDHGIDEIFIRRYFMKDRVNNRSRQDQIVVDFSKEPELITLNDGLNFDTHFSCSNETDNVTTFSIDDVNSRFTDFVPLEIIFEEEVLPYSAMDSLLQMELRWIANTPCGYADTISRIISVVDTIAPEFQPQEASIVVSCISEVNVAIASDACGLVKLEHEDMQVSNECEEGQQISRVYTAVDMAGNTSSVVQLITVIDTLAPVFNEVEKICASQGSSKVFAIDPCSNEKILAEVISKELVSECGSYSIYKRILRAVDDCGNESFLSQQVYGDNYTLEYQVQDPNLRSIVSSSQYEIDHGDTETLAYIRNLNETSVIAVDSCGHEYTGEYTIEYVAATNCDEGYAYTIEMHWSFLSLCEEEYAYSVNMKVLNRALHVEPVVFMNCGSHIPELNILGAPRDLYYLVDEVDERGADGQGTVMRNISVPDYCGESYEMQQIIFYEQGISAAIVGDMTTACGGTSNEYTVEVAGGTAPYEVEWAASEICEIEPLVDYAAAIVFTEPSTVLTATITDAEGCSVVSEATVTCGAVLPRSSNESSTEVGIVAFPNPAQDRITIRTTAELNSVYDYSLVDNMGVLHGGGSGIFSDGAEISLSVDFLKSGFYYFRIIHNGKEESVKFLKM